MAKPALLRNVALFGFGLIIALPVLVVAMPPLLDYPNHLVRFWLLAGGVSRVSDFYAVDWSHTATNLGMDVVGAALAHVLSAEHTGRVILGLSALLPCLGLGLLSRQVHGRWSWWQGLACLNTWPLTLLCGLMSFELSLGLALIAAYLDLRFENQARYASLARRTVQCLAILLVHPFGAFLYLGLVIALTSGWPLRLRPWQRWVAALAPMAMAAVIMILRMKLIPHEGPSDALLPNAEWQDPVFASASVARWLSVLVAPWRSYGVVTDALVPICFIGLALIAAMQRRLNPHAGLVAFGLALLFLGVFGPQDIGSTSLVDLRFLTMAGLVLTASILPDPRFTYSQPTLWALTIALVAGRDIWMSQIWQARQSDIAALYAAIEPLPSHARVLPIMGETGDKAPIGRDIGGISPSFAHLDALVVLRRFAYVPTLFAEAGKQPLSVKAPYDEDNEPSGGVLGTLQDLNAHDTQAAAYLGQWPQRYDYILMLNAETEPVTAIAGACLMRNMKFARLYKIGACGDIKLENTSILN